MLPFALALLSADPTATCPGTTTPEVEACLSQELGQAKDQQARYYEAARKRLSEENGSSAEKGLAESEQLWLAYRRAECSAVFDNWSAGTIRGSMEILCEIDLTRLRTYALWKKWLTFADSTPPILPRPPLEANHGGT
jgi:uncharacterized protein YecT (DUF1311 family)